MITKMKYNFLRWQDKMTIRVLQKLIASCKDKEMRELMEFSYTPTIRALQFRAKVLEKHKNSFFCGTRTFFTVLFLMKEAIDNGQDMFEVESFYSWMESKI